MFGIVLVIIGIVGRYFGDKRFEIISMGIFGMVSALWIASETQMLPILTGLFNHMGFKRDIEEIKRMTVGTIPTVILHYSYLSGNVILIASLPFLYSAPISPPICSTKVLAMESPSPVELRPVSTV